MGFTNPYPASRLTVDSTNSLVTGMQAFFPLTEGSGSVVDCILHPSHTGTVTNGTWQTGDGGTELFLSGSGSFVTIGDLNLNSANGLTVTAWIDGPSYGNDKQIVTRDNSGVSRHWQFRIDSSGKLNLIRFDSSNTLCANFLGATSLTNNVRYFVAFTFDSSSGSVIYLNGEADGTDSNTTANNSGTGTDILIGARRSSGSIYNSLNAGVQNCKVYDRALSASEIATLYHRPYEGSNYGDIWPYSPPASASMTLSTDTAATSLLSGMQAWFPLTEGTGTSAQCILHPSHIGTLNGGVSWENGERGVVASFDGVDDFIETNSNSTVTSFPVTVSAWVKSGGSSRDVIFGSYWANGTNRSLQCEIDASGRMYMLCSSTGSYQSSNSVRGTTTLSTTEYSHVVFVFEASGGTLYLNGEVESSSGSLFSTLNTPVVNFLIGAEGTASNQSHRFDGNISNVQVWDRAITATEVATLYQRPWEGIEYGDTFHHDPPAPASMLPLTSDSINTNQVGWWPLTETDDYASGAADISGSGNNGTPQSNAGSANTELGQVLEQPDANSYISVGDVSALKITGALSISIWLKTDSSTPVNIVSKYHATSGGRAYSLHLNRPELEFNINGTTVAQGTTQIRGDDEWHHLVGVYDPSNFIRVYVDGVLDGEVTTGVPSSITDTSYPFNIGRAWNGGNVVGFLQNCRVWNRVLTADEIWSIYANPWLGSNYKLASGSTPLYNYIFRTERFRRLG